MSSIDQQFVEFVVKSLVGKPDAVQIERRIDEKGVLLELTVDPEDLGRVIGKRGATAQSLRTLLRALGTKNEARYNLKIVDNGPPGAGRSHDDSPRADDTIIVADIPHDDAVSDDNVSSPTDDDQAAPAADQPSVSQLHPYNDAMNNEEETAALDKLAAAAPKSPAAEPEPEPAAEASASEEQASDRLAQTRKELAELDDLDV